MRIDSSKVAKLEEYFVMITYIVQNGVNYIVHIEFRIRQPIPIN